MYRRHSTRSGTAAITSAACVVEGCDRPVRVKVRGLCHMHYQRWRKHGDAQHVAASIGSRNRVGWHMPEEARAKIAAALTGKPKSPEHAAKMRARMRGVDHAGERNPSWTGEQATYNAVHLRLRKLRGSVCERADDSCRGRLDSAFSHDTPEERRRQDYSGPNAGLVFSTDPADYITLCHSHHGRYDASAPAGRKQGAA